MRVKPICSGKSANDRSRHGHGAPSAVTDTSTEVAADASRVRKRSKIEEATGDVAETGVNVTTRKMSPSLFRHGPDAVHPADDMCTASTAALFEKSTSRYFCHPGAALIT